ncbi:MAG: NAD(+)/NADH kinase [Clostridium sp.]|uniref:NAD(+)/NADH kinase n=1 Tax=Clostridium sp. TaxID=1506 RepID=UPI00306CBC86
MNKIGININTSKDKDQSTLNYVCNSIKEELPNAELYVFMDGEGLEREENKELDCLITLGGDGTILRAARKVYKFEIPIIGVNIGHLGFLASVDLSDFKGALRMLKNNEFKVMDRMMIKVTIPEKDNENVHVALNDVVITKGTLSRMITYDIFIDDSFYISYKADGLIVSTPTGSTAYSLSAGGPIVYPTINLISLTPICPISNGVGTIILDAHNKIKIRLNTDEDKVFLTCDGHLELKSDKYHELIIEAMNEKCKMIQFKDYDYFKILRKKIISRSMDCEEKIYERKSP